MLDEKNWFSVCDSVQSITFTPSPPHWTDSNDGDKLIRNAFVKQG